MVIVAAWQDSDADESRIKWVRDSIRGADPGLLHAPAAQPNSSSCTVSPLRPSTSRDGGMNPRHPDPRHESGVWPDLKESDGESLGCSNASAVLVT